MATDWIALHLMEIGNYWYLLNSIWQKVWLKQMWSNCKSNLKLSTFLEKKKEKTFFPISNRDENATSFCVLQKWKTVSETQNWLGIIKTLILFGLTLFVVRENRPDFHQIELFAFNFLVSGLWTSFLMFVPRVTNSGLTRRKMSSDKSNFSSDFF